MRWALIDGGVVVNVIEADGPLDGVTMVQSAEAGIGWTWDGQAFTPPDAPAPPRRLTWDQFRDLFPPERRVVLLAAAMQSPALLEFTLDAVAQGVDMASERTAAGLAALVAAQLVTAEERDRLLAGLPLSAV